MSDFGRELKRLRMDSGMRQQDLTESLSGVVARSTLASVESGRERPSARLWAALQGVYPQWSSLGPLYLESRAGRERPGTGAGLSTAPLAGPFALEESRITYTWRDHRVPEEIVEVRRVRALRDGADSYVLKLKTDGSETGIDAEVL